MKGSKAWNAKRELTVKPVPRKQACLDVILPAAIGLFLVLAILASNSASLTYPKHYEDIAIVCVANKNRALFKNPIPAKGAWK